MRGGEIMTELENNVLWEMVEIYVRNIEVQSSALTSRLLNPRNEFKLDCKIALEMLTQKKEIALKLKEKIK